MKRARNKKTSFFSKKDKNELKHNYNITETESAESVPNNALSTEPEDFAVPDDVIEQVIAENEAMEFSVSESEIDKAITEAADASEIDNLPESEIPFSTDDFSDTDTDITEAEAPIDEAAQLHEENRMKWEKKRRKKRIITVCIAVFICFIVSSFAFLGMDFSSDVNEDFITPVDVATGKMNILLLGVDKDGERSDSIMLVNYDFDTHAINLISIPRDTKMYVTDRAVTRKITEVHGMHDKNGKLYGASAVAGSVTALTGIPINYYIEFSFTALDNVMDILGPVTFDVPDVEGGGRGMNYDDDFQDLHIHLKPGVQELSGNQIQQFLRYRKSNYGVGDGSDISRISRQQDLLSAIMDQKLNISLILKIPDIFKEMKSQIKTNFNIRDVMKYAGYLKDFSSENMTTYMLPGESKLTGAWYYICNFSQTADLITNTFGYPVTAEELTNEISLTGKKASGKTESKKNSSKSDNKSSSSKNDDKKADNTKTETSSKSDTKKNDDESKSTSTKKDNTNNSSTSTKKDNDNSSSTSTKKDNESTSSSSTKKDNESSSSSTKKDNESNSSSTKKDNESNSSSTKKDNENSSAVTKQDDTSSSDKKENETPATQSGNKNTADNDSGKTEKKDNDEKPAASDNSSSKPAQSSSSDTPSAPSNQQSRPSASGNSTPSSGNSSTAESKPANTPTESGNDGVISLD